MRHELGEDHLTCLGPLYVPIGSGPHTVDSTFVGKFHRECSTEREYQFSVLRSRRIPVSSARIGVLRNHRSSGFEVVGIVGVDLPIDTPSGIYFRPFWRYRKLHCFGATSY